MTRPPVDHIPAPPFPRQAQWVNVAMLRMDQQRGHPVLIEFFDFCRANSMRTLPYLLRVIGVHTAGFAPSAEPAAVVQAVARLGIAYPVVIDAEMEIWQEYENLGWPARYLFNQDGRLFDYHYGEGAYDETELALQELLGVERPLVEPIRPGDVPGASLVVQSDDVIGPYNGPYEAGEVWAVLDGEGSVRANGETIAVDHPGAYRLIAHEVSTAGVLALEVGDGVTCHAVCFTPGVAE